MGFVARNYAYIVGCKGVTMRFAPFEPSCEKIQ